MQAYQPTSVRAIQHRTNNSIKKSMTSSYSTTKTGLAWPKMNSPNFWMIPWKKNISQLHPNRCSTLSRSVTAMETEGSRRRSWGNCTGNLQRDDWWAFRLEWKNIIYSFCLAIVVFSRRRLSQNHDLVCLCWALGCQCGFLFIGQGERKGRCAVLSFLLIWWRLGDELRWRAWWTKNKVSGTLFMEILGSMLRVLWISYKECICL